MFRRNVNYTNVNYKFVNYNQIILFLTEKQSDFLHNVYHEMI